MVAYVDLDERAIDALREFNEEGALSVLQQFKESDLSHVQVRPLLRNIFEQLMTWNYFPITCFPVVKSYFLFVTTSASFKKLKQKNDLLMAEFSETHV